MLLNNYYSIKNQQTAGSVTLFDILLLPECSVYEGHFPGMAVAPGVCNIQMIKELVERITGKQLLLEYIARCKFTALITPHQHRELQIRIEIEKKPPPTPPKGERVNVIATIGSMFAEIDFPDAGERVNVIATIGHNETDYMVFKGEYVTNKMI
jgi:3-hydroxyacyl-[acyl-carrier-protein] dehydratase